jgi:hypothetical protein
MGEERKPKVEGASPTRCFRGQRPNQRESRKEFKSKVVGLEQHTFDVAGAKSAAQFTRSLEEIADYVQREYTKGGGTIGSAIRDLQTPALVLPAEPTGTPAVAADPNAVPPILAQAAIPPTRAEIFMWEQDFKRTGDKIHQYEENCERAYALVWGQCSPELRNKLKSAPNYAAISGTQDVVQLLILIRGFCCAFDDQCQGTWSLQQAKKKAFLYVQKPGMANADYMEEFMAIIGVVETYGGNGAKSRGSSEPSWRKRGSLISITPLMPN